MRPVGNLLFAARTMMVRVWEPALYTRQAGSANAEKANENTNNAVEHTVCGQRMLREGEVVVRTHYVMEECSFFISVCALRLQ